RKGGSSTPEESNPNSRPVVDAGSDKTITLPDNYISLTGKASDKDGKITSYEWTKTSGGHARLSQASTRELKVSDLKEGTYQFKLTVEDNDGASASDDVKVIVKAAANKEPRVN